MRKPIFIIVLVLSIQLIASAGLQEYVNRPEDVFNWTKTSQIQLPEGAQCFELELTSQTWKDIIWKHRLRVLKPQSLKESSFASLFITGSGKGEGETALAAQMANITGSLVAILHDVPNQPLFDNLKEDDLIAHTLVKALQTGDEEWPCLLPMTKSAVKALDALQQFAKKELSLNLNKFVVAGASKRGWTTWLTAAVDSRVKGIAPMVYDNLNIPPQMKHQLEVFGKYSNQIDEYTKRGLLQALDKEEVKKIVSLIDPYTYRSRITIPKLMVMGTNDRYWTTDALNLYYKDLKGEKYILYVPNSGHELEDRERVFKGLIAFFLKVTGRLKFPQMSWRLQEKPDLATLYISSDLKPKSVSVWVAQSESRDFREATWKKVEAPLEERNFVAAIKKPQTGYIALFGEATYQLKGVEFSLSTNVYILKAQI